MNNPVLTLTASTAPYFKGPILKVQRANAHIEQFDSEVLRFLRRNPYRVRRQDNLVAGKTQIFSEVRELVPVEWSLIIADAVHNLRSSLDILANDFVAAYGFTSREWYFPICNSQIDFTNALSGKKPKLPGNLPTDLRDLVEGIQPYKRGNKYLRVIHDLDITDKHRFLVPTVTATLARVGGTSRMGGSISGGLQFQTDKLGETHDMSVPIEFKFEPNTEVVTKIFFGNSRTEPLTSILRSATAEIANVLITFERRLADDGKITI